MSAPQLLVGAVPVGPYLETNRPLLLEAEAGLGRLAAAGAKLALLPELFALPFYAEDAPERWQQVAEPLDGPTVQWAAQMSDLYDIGIVFGMPLLHDDDKRPFNAAVLTAPGRDPLVVSRKIHLAPTAGSAFGEADHFSAGPPVLSSFTFAGMRFVAVICYDRRYPEVWRAAARDGADAVLILVGGPAPLDPPGIFQAELRTNARANAVYAISAARYGEEAISGTSLRHDGETIAFDPNGAEVQYAISSSGSFVIAAIEQSRLAWHRKVNPTFDTTKLKPL